MQSQLLRQRDDARAAGDRLARAVQQHLRGEPVDVAKEVARCRRDLADVGRAEVPAEGGAFEGRLLLERQIACLAGEALAAAASSPGADLRAALRAFGEDEGPEWALR